MDRTHASKNLNKQSQSCDPRLCDKTSHRKNNNRHNNNESNTNNNNNNTMKLTTRGDPLEANKTRKVTRDNSDPIANTPANTNTNDSSSASSTSSGSTHYLGDTEHTRYIMVSKRLWRGEEDRKLFELVNMKGARNWDSIAIHFTNRSGKQCRERWVNHVSPEVSKAAWTEAEDKFVMDKVELVGAKWSAIAAMMPGRKDGAIKNRYMSLVRNHRVPRPVTWSATCHGVSKLSRGSRSRRSNA